MAATKTNSKTKDKATVKAKADTKATKTKGKADSTEANGKQPNVTANMLASLKALSSTKAAEGLTRIELQKAIKATITGYPRLVELGFVVADRHEGKREHYYTITPAGRKALAANGK